jgi:hypothetical protein
MFCAKHDSVSVGENMVQSGGVEIACCSNNYMYAFGDCTINGIIIIIIIYVRSCISSANDYLKRSQEHTGLCVNHLQ